MQLEIRRIIDRQEVVAAEMADLVVQLRAALASTVKASSPTPELRLSRVLVGTRWNELAARGSVGILLRKAARREELTYSDLHRELVAAGSENDIGMMQKYARPLDRICLALAQVGNQTGRVVPLLTVLVVNMRSRQPSPGLNPHLEKWLRAVGRDELAVAVAAAGMKSLAPRAAIDIAKKAVFDFTDWNTVIAAIGLTGDPASDMARAI